MDEAERKQKADALAHRLTDAAHNAAAAAAAWSAATTTAAATTTKRKSLDNANSNSLQLDASDGDAGGKSSFLLPTNQRV